MGLVETARRPIPYICDASSRAHEIPATIAWSMVVICSVGNVIFTRTNSFDSKVGDIHRLIIYFLYSSIKTSKAVHTDS